MYTVHCTLHCTIDVHSTDGVHSLTVNPILVMYTVHCTLHYTTHIHSTDGVHSLTVNHILVHVHCTLYTTLYNRQPFNRRGSFTYSKPHSCTCTLYTVHYTIQQTNIQQTDRVHLLTVQHVLIRVQCTMILYTSYTYLSFF